MIAPNGVPSGIPLSEIQAYAEMFGFDSMQDRFDLMQFVKACDEVWLQQVEKRRSNGNPKQHTKTRR
jgi:hypothetical protein